MLGLYSYSFLESNDAALVPPSSHLTASLPFDTCHISPIGLSLSSDLLCPVVYFFSLPPNQPEMPLLALLAP